MADQKTTTLCRDVEAVLERNGVLPEVREAACEEVARMSGRIQKMPEEDFAHLCRMNQMMLRNAWRGASAILWWQRASDITLVAEYALRRRIYIGSRRAIFEGRGLPAFEVDALVLSVERGYECAPQDLEDYRAGNIAREVEDTEEADLRPARA